MARSVHIIPEAGIRRIEELESRLAMVCPQRILEMRLTSGSVWMMLSPGGEGGGLAAIATLTSREAKLHRRSILVLVHRRREVVMQQSLGQGIER